MTHPLTPNMSTDTLFVSYPGIGGNLLKGAIHRIEIKGLKPRAEQVCPHLDPVPCRARPVEMDRKAIESREASTPRKTQKPDIL